MKHIEIWKQVKVSAFVLNECACMPNNLWVFHGQQLKQRTHTHKHSSRSRAHPVDCDNICNGGKFTECQMKAEPLKHFDVFL